MTTYLSNGMIDKFKILVLYVLKDIEIVDIRKIIYEEVFYFNEDLLSSIENLHLHNESYCSYLDSCYSDGYYTD